ncbi:MAG: serine/threonine-protein phosphatase, partial [Desulfobulbaceae bacterium]|nr:serine/threonine-protein phosphatase [Desulfobulbaceae bacterium]
MELFRKLFRSTKSIVASFGQTDTGRVRSHNEDTFCLLPEQQVFIVSDGMGGHNAGEVASRIAVESLVDHFTSEAVERISGNHEEICHFMTMAFRDANNLVMKIAEEDESLERMGCTLIACLIDHDVLHICHVGDVRCYITGESGLEQITNDHSYAAAFKKKSSEETEGKDVPSRNILTKAIGFPFPEDPEYNRRDIRKGNRLLMCSDGLWDMLDDQKLNKIIMEASNP